MMYVNLVFLHVIRDINNLVLSMTLPTLMLLPQSLQIHMVNQLKAFFLLQYTSVNRVRTEVLVLQSCWT
jgi:hypothetical protein